MLNRLKQPAIETSLKNFPVVAILGPRQCGKSTLAKLILEKNKNSIFLDLENPEALNKLENPSYFLNLNKDKLICLDEIQRAPELFKILRVVVDSDRRPGRFLILGSASQELIQQSSESLAGRISYHELAPFTFSEIEAIKSIEDLWLQGGFPDSLLATNLEASIEWRENFIKTFLERDLNGFGKNFSAIKMRRFWQMLSHYHGQVINFSKLGQSLDTSNTTVKNWLDVFEQTFMVRVLQPYSLNLKKRLVKSPKIYIRDSGILHTLLAIDTLDNVLGHPIAGSSWEGLALETLTNASNGMQAHFYRTSNGEEIDLILTSNKKKIGFEFKISSTPHINKNTQSMADELKLDHIYIVTPNAPTDQINKNVTITSLAKAIGVFT